MDILKTPLFRRAAWPGIAVAAAGGLLVGCQSYERAPLDLTSHRDTLESRLDAGEPINSFLSRLNESGGDTPDCFDPTDGLSVAEGEVLALFYNADLRLARLSAGVALANYETAGLWEDPQFGFDGAEILSPSGPFEYGLSLNLTIPVSGRLGVAKDRAEAAYETELRRIVDAEWSIRARVRSAWAAWTVADARVRLLYEVIGQVERIGSITDRLEAAGELTRIEARLLRSELLQTRGRLAQAEFAATQARLNLLGLLGLPPSVDIELVPSLAARERESFPDELQRLIEANTALAVRRAECHTAEETLRLEIRKQYPDIAIGGGYGSEDSDDRLLLGLSIPIPILNANRAGIAEARAQRDIARATAETVFEQLTRQLATTNAAIVSARTQLEAFETQLVPMLEEQSREVEQLIDLGEVDTLILLETVSRRFEAKNQLLDLRLAVLHAQVERARLLGPNQHKSPAPVEHTSDNTSLTTGASLSPAEEDSK
tara:strand:+ start:52168 stop:53634 length:1467 start_codon:yes stop_codon:yes gene_type:complete